MPARKRTRFSWAGLALAAFTGVAMAAPPRDGVLDPAFGTGGIARFDTLAGDTIRPRILYGIVALPDGGALVLGAGYAVDPQLPLSPLLPLVLRIDRHGALVPGFGTGGAFLLPALPGIEQFGARAISALPLADGRIVVVSAVARDDFLINTSFDDCAWVFALSSTGALLPSFGPTGSPGCIDFGDSTGVTFMGIPPVGNLLRADANGGVLVGGPPINLPGVGESAVARLSAAGTLDASFGSQGILRYGGDAFVPGSVAPGFIAAGGGLVAAAARQGNQSGVLRVDAAFGRDPTFGSNGFAGVTWTTAANATPYLSAFAVDALGRSLIAGYVVSGTPVCDFCVTRFLPNGSLDVAFNASGAQPGTPGSALIVSNGVGAGAALSIVIRSAGRLVVAGNNSASGSSQLLLLGLRDDASFDPRFGPAGTPGSLSLNVATNNGSSVFGAATAAADGGLLLGATRVGQGNDGIAIVRLVDDAVFADSLESAP
jgi:uncharacterized delta-60 repeat protein